MNLSFFTCLVLFILWPCIKLVENASLALFKDQLIYYSGSKMTLPVAEEKCAELGGRLPSVSSAEDAKELSTLIGSSNYVWLGTKKKSARVTRFDYEWTDGSPFNFREWHLNHNQCNAECCGLSLYSGSDGQLYDEPCTASNKVACIFNFTTKDLFNGRNSLSKIEDQERKLTIDKLNETFGQMTEHLKDEFNRLEDQFIRSLEILNASLINKEGQLKQLEANFSATKTKVNEDFKQQRASMGKLNETVTNLQVNEVVDAKVDLLKNSFTEYLRRLNSSITNKEVQLIELKGQLKNSTSEARVEIESLEVNLSSLHHQFNVCLWFLVPFGLALFVFLLIKFDLLWFLPHKKEVINTRNSTSQMESLNQASSSAKKFVATAPVVSQNSFANNFDPFAENVTFLSSTNSEESIA